MSASNIIDQTPGTTISLSLTTMMIATNASSGYVIMPFPFLAKNSNYGASASASTYGADTVGVETVGKANITSYTKYTNMIRLTVSGSFTAGRAYTTFGNINITFA